MKRFTIATLNGIKTLFSNVVIGGSIDADGNVTTGKISAEQLSLVALSGGVSAGVSISGSSAESAAITTGSAVVTPSTDVFFRQGTAASNNALSDGTDQILLAYTSYRITGITSGNTLAFKTTSANGTVYISPGA